MKWVFTFGFIFVTPVSIGEVVRTNFSIIPLNIWFSIMYVIIFTTIFAYFLNNYSLQKISPSANSSYMYLQPILATLVASFLPARSKLNMTEVIASLLIFTGVFFVNKRRVGKVAA